MSTSSAFRRGPRSGPVRSESEPPLAGLPINFHVTSACNFSCGHCFATFQDVRDQVRPTRDQQLAVVDVIGRAGAAKLTFSGGEPLLVPWLDELLARAVSYGVITCVVTNGSRVSGTWLDRVAPILDWLTLSIDSSAPDTNQAIGRAHCDGSGIDPSTMIEVSRLAHRYGIGLRVNTVVSTHNRNETLAPVVSSIAPRRWKIMQAMTVAGQGQGDPQVWSVGVEEFWRYVDRNRTLLASEVEVVAETADMMRGSYAMVDPWGRVFDSKAGAHTYRHAIIDHGSRVLQDAFDLQLLERRHGLWDWEDTRREDS